MLLKKAELEAIRAGEITLVFRRWRRPTVKTGGTLRTAIGVLAIDRVAEVARSEISDRDAKRAGHDSKDSLLAALDRRDGSIYRIDVRYAGADPRIELRNQDDLSVADIEGVRAKLGRLDAASREGAWTHKVLRAIERHPRLAAVELARKMAYEKDWLKVNIRKLKNLGLTISHQPGYELSPRGRAVIERLGGDA